MTMMTVAQTLMMGPFCSPRPIQLELRMTRAEEEKIGRSNSYRREKAHIQLEGWGYEGKWDCYYPHIHINYEVP